jgi:F-type H+-transporting ATPase subunit epsilon
MPLPQSIHLEVVTPEKRLVSEVVDEVILPGSEGSLGVLPGHTPLLTTLGIGELVYRRAGARRYVAVAWGFAEVLPDRVSVLAEIAERAEGIDRERAAAARDRALRRLRERAAETDFVRAQAALQKAIIRLQVSQGIGPSEPS